jgi:hypothetical protein
MLVFLAIALAGAFHAHAVGGEVCFPREEAAKLLQDELRLPRLEALIEAQDRLAAQQKLQIRTGTTAWEALDRLWQAEAAENSDLKGALQQAEADRDSAQAWYHSPALWAGAGFVFGVAAVVLTALALR